MQMFAHWQMIQLQFSIKQMNMHRIKLCMGALHSFVWTYVKYANMEGFRRDSHILAIATQYATYGITENGFSHSVYYKPTEFQSW